MTDTAELIASTSVHPFASANSRQNRADILVESQRLSSGVWHKNDKNLSFICQDAKRQMVCSLSENQLGRS